MSDESIAKAEELARMSNQWLDRASPWVPFWSAYCMRQARVYGDQLTKMAHESARKALGEE